VLRTCLRDMFSDLAVPGGIANCGFVVDWGSWCRAMDQNNLALLPKHTRFGIMLIARWVAACCPPHAWQHLAGKGDLQAAFNINARVRTSVMTRAA